MAVRRRDAAADALRAARSRVVELGRNLVGVRRVVVHRVFRRGRVFLGGRVLGRLGVFAGARILRRWDVIRGSGVARCSIIAATREFTALSAGCLACSLGPARHPRVPGVGAGPVGRRCRRCGDTHPETFDLGAEPPAQRAQDRFAQIAFDGLLGQRRGDRKQCEALGDSDRLDQFQPGLLRACHRGDCPVGRTGGEFGDHLGPHRGQHVLLVVHAVSSPEVGR